VGETENFAEGYEAIFGKNAGQAPTGTQGGIRPGQARAETRRAVQVTHRERVERYPGSLEELASDLGDLRYDALARFLDALASKLARDARGDESQGRPRLAGHLGEAAQTLANAAASVGDTWKICGPRMNG
jgi:hypothetical protein